MATGRCNWADCNEPVIQIGRGRPRTYCPAHAKASAAESKRAYKRAGKRVQQKPQPHMPRCCADWQLSGRSRKICPQHRQWMDFCQYRRRTQRRKKDLDEFAELLSEFCGGEASERNFTIIQTSEQWGANPPVENWEDDVIAHVDAESGRRK